MQNKEKSFKIKKIQKYEKQLKKCNDNKNSHTLLTSMFAIMTILSYKRNNFETSDFFVLKLIANMIFPIACITELSQMIEVISKKVLIKQKIEDLRFELKFEEELENEELQGQKVKKL